VQHGRAFRAARSLWQGQAAADADRSRSPLIQRGNPFSICLTLSMNALPPAGTDSNYGGRRLSLRAVGKILDRMDYWDLGDALCSLGKKD
jgi:hypothetical protein